MFYAAYVGRGDARLCVYIRAGDFLRLGNDIKTSGIINIVIIIQYNQDISTAYLLVGSRI